MILATICEKKSREKTRTQYWTYRTALDWFIQTCNLIGMELNPLKFLYFWLYFSIFNYLLIFWCKSLAHPVTLTHFIYLWYTVIFYVIIVLMASNWGEIALNLFGFSLTQPILYVYFASNSWLKTKRPLFQCVIRVTLIFNELSLSRFHCIWWNCCETNETFRFKHFKIEMVKVEWGIVCNQNPCVYFVGWLPINTICGLCVFVWTKIIIVLYFNFYSCSQIRRKFVLSENQTEKSAYEKGELSKRLIKFIRMELVY